jgi:polyphosphate kinase 2 (PPK2 family)
MLEKVDLSLRLRKSEYREALLEAQLELRRLALELYRAQRSAVVVYEGWDAAGKGGNIRRVTEMLDPRGFHVYQIAAPEGDDRIHHYLWRFWRRLLPPDEKQLLLFDRSWYGRVLVERVEGFAEEAEWRRAYREINEFERHLRQGQVILVKFWIHISPEEQLARFEAREETPHKKWKLTDEDWRNRQKWDAYEEAVEEMLLRTSTATAPWTVISGNDKRHARVQAARHLASTLADHLHDPEGRLVEPPS